MKDEFKNIRMVDNFYQTSSFIPMPTIEISTLDENGNTNIGSYSLCFPYYIAGKDYYAMILECRNSSNTCKNICPNQDVQSVDITAGTCTCTNGEVLDIDNGG